MGTFSVSIICTGILVVVRMVGWMVGWALTVEGVCWVEAGADVMMTLAGDAGSVLTNCVPEIS